MTQCLAEICRHPDEAVHDILPMDRAGWHISKNLVLPRNISILQLQPKSPELNPVESLWQSMRQNWLSSRVCTLYKDIVDHRCDAQRKLESQLWLIMSIGQSKWAHEF